MLLLIVAATAASVVSPEPVASSAFEKPAARTSRTDICSKILPATYSNKCRSPRFRGTLSFEHRVVTESQRALIHPAEAPRGGPQVSRVFVFARKPGPR